MTREEASKIIKDGLEDMSLDYIDIEQYEALTMAIKALEQEPSGDLISRQAVLDAIEDDNRNGMWSCFVSDDDAQKFKTVIKELPSVKQEPKTGHWIESNIPNEKYVCSECGGACWYYDCQGDVAKSKYCPNCGCRMKGEIE